MTTPEEEKKPESQNKRYYSSPSRMSVVTPIKHALKTSNNNVGLFLKKLEALNKMNQKLKDLSLKKSKEENKENDLN